MAWGPIGHRPPASLAHALCQAVKPTAPHVPIGNCHPPIERHPHVHLPSLSSSHVGYHQSQVNLLLQAAFLHSAAAIPTPLCTKGRQQVAASPPPPTAVLVHHRCPESGLVLVSNCATAMCLRSTAVTSAMGLAMDSHFWPIFNPAATSSRKSAALTTTLSHHRRSTLVETRLC
jgi:hypothetical protein